MEVPKLFEEIYVPCENYIYHKLHYPGSGFLKSEILSRITNIGLAALVGLTHMVDIAVGLGFEAAAIITFGQGVCFSIAHQRLFPKIRQQTSFLFFRVLCILNPSARLILEQHPGYISAIGNGFIPALEGHTFFLRGIRYINPKEHWAKQQIASRLCFALHAMVCVVTRLADAILSVQFAFLSIILLGRAHQINNICYRTLQFQALILDFIECFQGVIYPESMKVPSKTSVEKARTK